KLNPAWTIAERERRSIRLLWPSQYEWASAARWVDSLVGRFGHLVRVDLVDNIAQPYKGTVVFGFEVNGRRSKVAIAYTDYPDIDENCARQCQLCFKMQYRREGYGYDNVIPGGYVAGARRLYLHLSKLRQHRDERNFRFEVYGRFGRDFGRETRERAVSML